MRKIIFSLLFLTSTIAFSGNPKDDKVKYLDTSVVVGETTVQTHGGLSNDAFVRTKITVINKNDYFILLDPSKSYFYSAGSKIPTKEKEMIISPNGKKSSTFDVKGKNLTVQAMSLILDGFMKTGNEKTIAFPEITVSPKRKENFSNIEVVITDIDYAKDFRLNLRIKVTNVGNDIVILNPGVMKLVKTEIHLIM